MVEAGFTLGIAIVFAAMGDILFSKGMQAHGEVKVHSFWDIPPLMKHVFTNPLVLAGMGSMAINLASYVAALEYVDVSVANPITSLSYLVATIYMAFIVHQRVSRMRWIGLFLITAGAICVGITS